MSFTGYTRRHVYIFPKSVRIRVDLPRFPEFFTRFRRNYQNRGKKMRSMYAYIFDESMDGEEGIRDVIGAQRNFDA